MSRGQTNQHTRSTTTATARREMLGGAAALVVLALLAYLPALGGSYVMDDDIYVTEQPVNRSLDGLRRIWLEPRSVPQYYPLLHTSFWLQYQIWQQNPVGYHAVNVLLHACIVVMAWRILVLLQVPGAWLAAAIFAVHPVCVESVAWVTKLMNLQSMLLVLGSLWCYLQYEPAQFEEGAGGRDAWRWLYYALSLTLFLLALLSKTVVASLPAVLLVIYWWKRGKIGWRDVRPLLPLFVLGIAFGLMTAWLERYHAGALGADWSLTLVERCLLAGRAVWFYAGKLVWPYPLMFYYPRWTVDASAWWQYLFPAGVLAVILALWLVRNWIGRGPLVAVLIYLGVLFPALGFFNVFAFQYSFVADHYQYHAMLALIALAAVGWSLWYERTEGAARSAAIVAAVVVAAAFMILTWRQSRLYADAVTLYEATLEQNPASWAAHNNLANALLKSERLQEAIQHFQQALRLNPEHFDAQNNLGVTLFRTGRREEGIEHIQRVLGRQPKMPEAHYNMGLVLAQSDRTQEAIEYFQEALRLKPDYAEAHNNLATALIQTGDTQAAIEHYRDALRIRPDYLMAAVNLAEAHAKARDFPAAVTTGQRALELARASGQTAVIENIEQRLRRYRAGQVDQSASPQPDTSP